MSQRSQELLGHLHGPGVEPVAHPPPLARFGAHETRVDQQDEVLGDRLARNRKPIGQICGRGRALCRQRGQDRSPGGVGQGREDLLRDQLDVSRHRGRQAASR